MDKLEKLFSAHVVYVISKKQGVWQVNKTLYDLRSQEDQLYVNLIPQSEKYNPYMKKYFRKYKIENVFTKPEEAQEECNKRNAESLLK